MQINNPVPPTQDVSVTSVPVPLDLEVPDNADSQSPLGAPGLLPVIARIQALDNAGKYDRVSSFIPYDDEADLVCLLTGAHSMFFNGLAWDRARTPNVFKWTQGIVPGSGNLDIWTPATGKKFRLMGYAIDVTNNASLATAGAVRLQFIDGASVMPVAHELYLPATAGTTIGAVSFRNRLGNGILSAAANNTLALQNSTAFASGNISVYVFGVEE